MVVDMSSLVSGISFSEVMFQENTVKLEIEAGINASLRSTENPLANTGIQSDQ
jgi:hypothetical protein